MASNKAGIEAGFARVSMSADESKLVKGLEDTKAALTAWARRMRRRGAKRQPLAMQSGVITKREASRIGQQQSKH